MCFVLHLKGDVKHLVRKGEVMFTPPSVELRLVAAIDMLTQEEQEQLLDWLHGRKDDDPIIPQNTESRARRTLIQKMGDQMTDEQRLAVLQALSPDEIAILSDMNWSLLEEDLHGLTAQGDAVVADGFGFARPSDTNQQ